MCASKIGRMVGVGEGVGEGDGVGLGVGVGEATATVAVAIGDGELAAGCPHAASNTTATSNRRAITL
jgi:transketolase N-terminal domain/subunit